MTQDINEVDISMEMSEEDFFLVSIGGELKRVPVSCIVRSSVSVSSVELLAANWVGESSPYSQVVNINGVTENSQVNLTPSVEQLTIFYNKDLAFVTENDNGVVTVYAIGQKPTNDYTIQATITEVIA